nr:hypothetical protein CFP56_06398 [Quercus suber]
MDKETARTKNTRWLQLPSQTSDFSSLRAVLQPSVNKTRRHTRLTDINTVDGKRILGTLNLKSLSLPSLLCIRLT